MYYGGTRSNGVCGGACDFMPRADVPGWHLGKDANGCAIWVEPANVASSDRCGAADAGTIIIEDGSAPPRDANLVD